jgi:hypothetical protein
MTAHTGLVMCVCPSVCLFELGKWTDYDEIWFGHFIAFESKNWVNNFYSFCHLLFPFFHVCLSLSLSLSLSGLLSSRASKACRGENFTFTFIFSLFDIFLF